MTLLAEKRKVGSSTLPLTTIASPAGSLHYLRLACSRDVFVSILAGVPGFAAECRRVRGDLVGWPGTRACGISAGVRRRRSATHAAVCLRTSDTGFRSGFAVRPAWLATGQRGLTGLL